jgi:thiosulfate/3-mercaptopyruvate sulfurtransferase
VNATLRSLISAGELAARLDAAGGERPALLDVRWEAAGGPLRDDYEAGHIPGAAFVDLDADLAAPAGAGGRHPLPDADAFTAAMRRAGVDSDRPVVVYDAASAMAAARAWWLLRYYGHDRVAVLDGGLAAWTESGLPLQTVGPEIAAGNFTAVAGGMLVLDAGSAGELGQRSGAVLIDARAPERFRGESEPIDPVAGHIPGAVNRPTAANVEADGRFRDGAELRAAFEALGVDGRAEVGAYCGSGVTAAHEVLALELAGFTAALYPGSWSGWITDRARPVARRE